MQHRTNRRQAFTLIELIVVILILAILAALIIPRIAQRTDDARNAKALTDIQTMKSQLATFRLDVGRYPTTEEGLESLTLPEGEIQGARTYLDNLPVDPWNNPYIYSWPGAAGDDSYFIFSGGPDGQPDTEDDVYPAN